MTNKLAIIEVLQILNIDPETFIQDESLYEDENVIKSNYIQYLSIFLKKEDFYKLIKNNNALIKVLNFRFQNIGPEGTYALFQAIQENTILTEIDIWDNNIENTGVEAISSLLKDNKNTSLFNLNIGNNNIDALGAEAIANCLLTNTTLLKLSMHRNYIVSQGAKAIAFSLQFNTTLSHLRIDYNSIGPEGAEAFAGALQSNTSLLYLSLSGNNIGPIGAAALAVSLTINTTLINLYILSNNIGDEGAEALATCIKLNTSLTICDIRCNTIGPIGAEALALALQNNTTLIEFNLDKTNISYDYKKTISNYIQRNEKMRALQFWKPCHHPTFSCHQIVMSSLLCNDENSNSTRIPSRVWEYIFSFLQRKHLE
jgi:Ran GTPase-activating protein (RanGAP) involved in mRNA processing and transport